MTPFELVEARSNLTGLIGQIFYYWISITFAVVVAGFAAGDQFGGFTFAIVVLLYTIVTLFTAVTTNRIFAMVSVMTEEACLTQDRSDERSPAVDLVAGFGARNAVFSHMMFGVRAITFVCAVGYLTHRAGYIG